MHIEGFVEQSELSDKIELNDQPEAIVPIKILDEVDTSKSTKSVPGTIGLGKVTARNKPGGDLPGMYVDISPARSA